MGDQPDLDWLGDPRVFAVNRLAAHSDHAAYPDAAAARAGGAGAFRQCLNGRWKFALSPDLARRPEGFHELGFDASGWDDVDVPGHMQLQGFGANQYVNAQYPWDGVEPLRPPQVPQANLVGSYLRDFDFTPNGDQVVLCFEGVETAFFVWLNGAFVGYGEDSFTPARFDVTPHLRAGVNRLAVQVFQRSSASWLEDQDFWRLTGIFRDVRLERRPALHLEDLFVTTDLSDDFRAATLRLRLKLRLPGSGGSVDVALTGPEGAPVARMQAGADAEMELRLPVDAPLLWSAEQPTLYDLMILLRDEGGGVVEAIPERVGFRRFEIVDKVMRLNGRRIVFNGVNRHEFDPRLGRAITHAQMLWDVRFLKRRNINAVRASHYPNQGAWYRLCDEYGLYVIDEANLETHGSWQKNNVVDAQWAIPDDLPEWRDAVLDRGKSMLERSKNRPSILIWSCGNESYGGKTIFEMSEYLRARDPSRLVHYEGVYHDRRYNGSSDIESRMYASPQEVEFYLSNGPEKPFIMCEYMHSMGNSCGGMHLYTDLIDAYPQYQGGFIWDYMDQALAVTRPDGAVAYRLGGEFDDRPSDYAFCANGIVTADRRAKPAMQEVRALYQSVDLRPGRDHVEIVNRNLFVSTADQALTCRVLRDGVEVFADEMTADVAPGARLRLPLTPPDLSEPGEYAMQCALRLKTATLWAGAGHETAFGEHVWTVAPAPPPQDQVRAPAPALQRVTRGDLNFGVGTSGFSALFSHVFGGLSSLKAGGCEWILRPPKLIFWRAPTENDRGCNLGFDLGVWRNASLYQKVASVEAAADAPEIRYRFALPGLSVAPELSYRVEADGAIRMAAEFPGLEGAPDLPLFGLQFALPARLERIRYYGLGPQEAYLDRCRGARLGIYRYGASDALSAYLVAQECGNRMGVRWAEATGADGAGLRFESEAAPFELCALPHDACALEAAARPEDLPPPRQTVLRIAAKQMGVGGDDSWGAPVQPRYRIRASEPLSLRISLRPVGI